ncbi:MAG: YheC/YheD family protein [Hydrogenibacillus schlegelii]|nr:YheC/YheD family protein [Hydrogenibacillus schlegelii]
MPQDSALFGPFVVRPAAGADLWLALPPAALPDGTERTAVVRFGHAAAVAELKRLRGPGARRVVAASPDLLGTLGLWPGARLFALRDGGTLRVGPLIGIATAGPARRKRALLEAFARLRPDVPFAVFDLRDVDWARLRVPALVWTERGPRSAAVPLPDVVYNKIPSRRLEQKLEREGIFDRWYALSRAPIVNASYFHKWDVYLDLIAYPEIRPNLPETILAPDEADVADLLARHRRVYLKPAEGAKGRGIIRLDRGGQEIVARFYLGGRPRLRRVTSLRRFLRQAFPPGRLRSYIAQQGIPLIAEGGRPVDFRLHLAKGEDGRWHPIVLAAKVAGEAGVTTHLAYGGRLDDAGAVLGRHFGEQATGLRLALLQFGRAVAEKLEHATGQPLIELGLDLGVDEDGRLWLFEANAKPGQAAFGRDRHLVRLRRLKLIAALIRLAGFPAGASGEKKEGPA